MDEAGGRAAWQPKHIDPVRVVDVGQQYRDLAARQDHRYPDPLFRSANLLHPRQLDVENPFLQAQNGRQGLAMRGGGYFPVIGEI